MIQNPTWAELRQLAAAERAGKLGPTGRLKIWMVPWYKHLHDNRKVLAQPTVCGPARKQGGA